MHRRKVEEKTLEGKGIESVVSYASALLYGVGGIVVAGMALLFAFQDKLVYEPVLPGLSESYAVTPAPLRLLYEDAWPTSSDGVLLHSWFIKLFPDYRVVTYSEGFPSQHGITKDAQIKQPVLFLSGLRDEMVPPSHLEMLYAKAATRNRQCSFVEFPTGMHMDTWLAGGEHYCRTIQEFLAKTVPEKKDVSSTTPPRKLEGR